VHTDNKIEAEPRRRLSPEPAGGDESLAAQVVRLRRHRRLSQEDLARAIERDQASMSRVERDLPTTTTLLGEIVEGLDARLVLVPSEVYDRVAALVADALGQAR
jgi:transcriptional regulator with XRE-family HTH domain